MSAILIDTLWECDSDTSDAAQMLLPPPPDSQPAPSRGTNEHCCSKYVVDQTPRELSPTDILREHRVKFHREKSFDLVVKRDNLWRSALPFYKNCLHHPERLFYELRIEVEGEKGWCFEVRVFSVCYEGDEQQAFQGELARHVPKRDSNIQYSRQA